jgi:orotidine-5'-phosphate decarboxylase
MKKNDTLKNKSDVFVALDYPDKASALEFIDKIDADSCHLKVGLEMFTRLGPEWVSELIAKGFDVFLDLKCYDIPNTVAKTMKSITGMGVSMTTLHAMGGVRMMQAAKEAIANLPEDQRPLLLAVTILTSFSEEEMKQLFGETVDLTALAYHLAKLAKQAGMDGVICSPHEAQKVREICGKDFCIVTPGIRLESTQQSDDQKRTATPTQAREQGANFLVIGRPITQSKNPVETLKVIG